MKENNKVLLGMSGGTDSSVAAMLLLDAGYEVTGTTFRFFEKDNNTEYLDDARELCSRLGIPHITYDLRDKFKEYIIDYFIKEYMAGRTPVPCTLCNNYLKIPYCHRTLRTKNIMRRILAYQEWYRPRQRPVFLPMGTPAGYYGADDTAVGKYNQDES